MSGFIQIAGLKDAEEAELAVKAGVQALGFPFRLDHHREDLSEAAAKIIIASLPATVLPVLITYLANVEEVLALSRFLGVRGVQLHGKVSSQLGMELKARAPDLWLIKSLVVRQENEMELAKEMQGWESSADAFLTDTYDPQSGASGATGRSHDWQVSRRLAALSAKPLILAGGLNPGNVAAAIATVRPWGVDVHTGVENAQGRKEKSLVESFAAEAGRAFRQLAASACE